MALASEVLNEVVRVAVPDVQPALVQQHARGVVNVNAQHHKHMPYLMARQLHAHTHACTKLANESQLQRMDARRTM